MSWSRFDDRYAQHPKLAALGDWYEVGLALDVAGIGWCNGLETDGTIPKPQVDRLIRCANMRIGRDIVTPQKVAQRLVAVGRWEDHGDTYKIHDFLAYNPSRAQNEEKRRQVAERVKRHRNGVTRGDVTQDVTLVSASRNAAPEPEPEPVTEERSGERSSGARAGDASPGVHGVFLLPTAIPTREELGDVPAAVRGIAEKRGCVDVAYCVARWHTNRWARRTDRKTWRTDWWADCESWFLEHQPACVSQGGAGKRGPRAVPASKPTELPDYTGRGQHFAADITAELRV